MWLRGSMLPKAMAAVLANNRQVHATSLARMPRGLKVSVEQPADGSDNASDRWKRYLDEPPNAAQSMDSRVVTSFGSIRLDKHNVPKVQAADDDPYDEEAEEKMPVLHVSEKQYADPNWPRIVSRGKGADAVAVNTEPDVADRNFFLERDDDRILASAPDRAFNASTLKAAGSEQGRKIKLSSENFSFAPGKASNSLKDELKTVRPNLGLPSRGSSTGQKPRHSQSEDRSSSYRIEKPDLSDIDEQYFGALRNLDPSGASLEIGADELAETRKLVKDSTRNLSFIDSQIFPSEQPHKARRPAQSTPKDNEGSLKRDMKPLDANPGSEKVRKSKASNEKDGQVLTAQDLRNPPLSSALGFVQKLRLEKASSLDRKVTKDPGDEIGVSLQHKLEAAANLVSPIGELKKETSVATQVKQKGIIRGKLEEKFIPQSLFDLTSIEVLEILKRSIVFDKYDIVAVNKPFGMPMYCDDSDRHRHALASFLPQLATALKTEQLLQVHRLDVHTTGIVLLAKTAAMQQQLCDLFRARKIDKRYWGIVRGVPEPATGIISIPIGEKKIEGRFRMTIMPYYKGTIITNKPNPKKDIFPAVTEYRILKTSKRASLLELKPITGFRHQIRVHLGLGLGCPILGDHRYTSAASIGKPQKLPGEVLDALDIRQSKARDVPLLLHAKHIQIPEIVAGKNVWVDAPMPPFFTRILRRLKLTPDEFVKI